MVELTNRAQETLRRLIEGAETDADGLRIMVNSGGCSGLQYGLSLERAACDGDRVYAFGDLKVYVDPNSQSSVEGMRVDFVESVEASGFVFDNPNAKDLCSCGKSFSN